MATSMITTQPQRRSLRLRDYNYSESGAYFVTICTQDRMALFGEVVNGEMCLNDAGRMVQDAWQNLPGRFPGWDIDTWVVMPDHFHGILIRDDTLHRKTPFTRRGGSPCPPGSSGSQAPNMLSDIMQRFKSYTTHQYGRAVAEKGWPTYPQRLWQRSYYEHVIRNEQDLTDIRDYIVNNPISRNRKNRTGTIRTPTRGVPTGD